MVPLLAFAACKTENDAFCKNPDNAGVEGCPDGMSGGHCASNTECTMVEFPVCELSIDNGTCKACSATNRGACKDKSPRCENNSCTACVDDDADCAGGVCMLDGSCAASDKIVYASASSALSTNCGDISTNPCSLAGAIGLTRTDRNIVKLVGLTSFIGSGFQIDKDVIIDARGAILGRTGGGVILTIPAGRTVTLLGGIVRGIAGGAEGIKCMDATLTMAETKVELNDQPGVSADNCTLDFRRVTVLNNSQKANTFKPGIDVTDGSIELSRSRIEGNNGGGLRIDSATFKIVSNVFFNNGPMGTGGDPPSPIGGLGISTAPNDANRLEFNTIVGNHAQASAGPGLACTAGTLTTRNNIIWNNNENSVKQFAGGCTHSYSDLGFETVDANNNMHVDPMLTGDQHLMANSPMIGKADPRSNLGTPADRDIDNERRLLRTDMGADIGADQYYPPK